MNEDVEGHFKTQLHMPYTYSDNGIVDQQTERLFELFQPLMVVRISRNWN